MLWREDFKKYDLLCWEEGDFFFGGGVACLQLRRVEMGKKKEKYRRRGSVERGYINFCRRLHQSAHLTVNRACHRTRLPFWTPSDSVGICIGESITSPYGADVLNPLVIPSVKNTRNNLHVSEPPFFYILNIPSIILSVATDGITDGLNSVGNGDLKLPTELFTFILVW
jgi:hypothetical protein